MRLRYPPAAYVVALTSLAVPAGAMSPLETVEAFGAALDRGDYHLARTFLSDDPRVWYESREGDGFPLKPETGGRYRAWDKHFNSHSEIGPWTVEGDTVWAIAEEMNDYHRLIERQGVPRHRITYFLDGAGKIEGYMISAAYPTKPEPPPVDRFEEFAAWVRANHSEEWEYLRPEGELDPTGDRAPRTRRLLELWRATVGLPALR